jgi:hypothetical protein
MERCTHDPMPLYQIGKGVEVRCVLYDETITEREKSLSARADA